MTYPYQCTACGHEWEAEQRIVDPAIKRCPACGKDAAQRMVGGGTSFRLRTDEPWGRVGWASSGYAGGKG